jgi:predicted DCC family thiol-disulfide oxidoreductase YuxK
MKTTHDNFAGRHWLIFDGDCGMCRRCAHWALRHDKRNLFVAAPSQNTPSPPMNEELRRACEGAVHVITRRGEVLRGGRAVMFLLREIAPKPWGFIPRILGRAPWIYPIEIGYNFVARNRPLVARFFFPNEDKAPLEPFTREDVVHTQSVEQ